ncbi:MAG: hypothetical protein KDB27_01680 [Planctomycetales bacterium]|nr:hypothetical protein [Planctomycetales bacterium]
MTKLQLAIIGFVGIVAAGLISVYEVLQARRQDDGTGHPKHSIPTHSSGQDNIELSQLTPTNVPTLVPPKNTKNKGR